MQTNGQRLFALLVKVTDEDIQNGKSYDPCKCPIALALRRQTGLNAAVGNGATLFTDDLITYESTNWPEIADRFIINFDTGRPVTPIEFDLDFAREELVAS